MVTEQAPYLVTGAAILWILSGLPGFVFSGRRSHATSTALGVTATVLALVGAVLALLGYSGPELWFTWPVPDGGGRILIDRLSAVFVVPTVIVGAAGAIYGHGYWPTDAHPTNARRLRLFYGILVGAILLVVTARHALLFILAWELMAIAAFFLVTTEDEHREVRNAGWIYLLATHFGALCLLAAFSLMAGASGSFLWEEPVGTGVLAGGTLTAVFLLSLVGFGVKAGIVPLHFWLPGAHANAPSHVSSLLSAGMLNAGVYGVLRMLWLLPTPPVWWGGLLVAVGLSSALYGVSLAVGQADMKRMLAYSSIENMGIIFTGIGLATLGRSAHSVALAQLGLVAALLHVWNHSLFKSLLFLGAGSVLHATGTRVADRLGGLIKLMPVTGTCMLVGSVAAAGLPPLNAFIGEWVLYLASFRSLSTPGVNPVLGAGVVCAISLLGGLALAAFAKLFGVVFLGSARSEAGAHAHEATGGMQLTMVGLAGLCLAAAVSSPLLARVLEDVGAEQLRLESAPTAVWTDVRWPAGASAALLFALAAGYFMLDRRIKANGVRRAPTWGCGYLAPSPTMQYTGRSFTAWLSELLPPAWMRAQVLVHRPEGLFPTTGTFASVTPDPFESWYRPLIGRWVESGRGLMRRFQQGQLQLYLSYMLVTLVALLTYMVASTWWSR